MPIDKRGKTSKILDENVKSYLPLYNAEIEAESIEETELEIDKNLTKDSIEDIIHILDSNEELAGQLTNIDQRLEFELNPENLIANQNITHEFKEIYQKSTSSLVLRNEDYKQVVSFEQDGIPLIFFGEHVDDEDRPYHRRGALYKSH